MFLNKKQTDRIISDIGARLPYKVIVRYTYYDFNNNVVSEDFVATANTVSNLEYNKNIKPYLRPMDDITEDEIQYLSNVISKNIKGNVNSDGIKDFAKIHSYQLSDIISFLDKRMIDHRGLIKSRLAYKAKKNMYNSLPKIIIPVK